MDMSRRQTIQLSAGAVAALSLAAARPDKAVAQAGAQTQADRLVETRLRPISDLPLNADGSAKEFTEAEAGPIDGALWKTKGPPDIEFDYRKMKVKLDGRGTSNLSGTLSFSDLEKLPRHTQITLLQCGAPKPRGIVKWTGVRFSDFAKAMGAQSFANYVRLTASDDYYLDEDMKTMMHPQVMLAWMANDKPLPPENGAPMRLVVPFRYGARSVKAITAIAFTATSFPPQKGWPA